MVINQLIGLFKIKKVFQSNRCTGYIVNRFEQVIGEGSQVNKFEQGVYDLSLANGIRQADLTENITFPQTMYAGGNELMVRNIRFNLCNYVRP